MGVISVQIEGLLAIVDTHTAGEPTRIVVFGGPRLSGGSVREKMVRFRTEFDWIRCAVLLEPRGHADMFGAILIEPGDANADFGVIFMDTSGYLDMCIHGVIGVTTMLLETGIKPKKEPVTQVILETPAGLVISYANIKDGHVVSVTVRSVPCFVHLKGLRVYSPFLGREVGFDIAFGGNFAAIIEAEQLGTPLSRESVGFFARLGAELRTIINTECKVEHPTTPSIREVNLIEFTQTLPGLPLLSKNLVVFGAGQMYRSPCGTGTCAKMALLAERGCIGLGEAIISEGVLGTRFTGRLVDKVALNDREAWLPEVTGSAYLTGCGLLLLDSRDPLRYGFRV